MITFISSRWADIAFRSYQHISLVVQSLVVATLVALVVAVLVVRWPKLAPVTSVGSAIGLTIPGLALLGLLIPVVGIGIIPSVLVVVFYAILPILRNAVVGLNRVSPALVDAARGQGMSTTAIFIRVQLPLAWPVILTGVRVSAQMSMGVAAITAYVLGPGLGGYIFTGLSQIGNANALNYALVGTVGIVLLALVLDAVLAGLGRVTTSKGIRA